MMNFDLSAFDAPANEKSLAGNPDLEAQRAIQAGRWSEILNREIKQQLEKAKKPRKKAAKKFTTEYAIAWGRKQGWKLVERESYNFLTKRHADCQLGMDAIFDDGNGLVGIQGAGKSEYKAHWDRFEARGGVEVAQRRHIRIIYLEFAREDKKPIVRQDWC